MTGTIRRRRAKGSRLLSLFSDTALEQVERSASSSRSRSGSGRSRSGGTRSPSAAGASNRSTGNSRSSAGGGRTAARTAASRSGTAAPGRPAPPRSAAPGPTRRAAARPPARSATRAPSRDPRGYYPDYGYGPGRQPRPGTDEPWFDDDSRPEAVPARPAARTTGRRAPSARPGSTPAPGRKKSPIRPDTGRAPTPTRTGRAPTATRTGRAPTPTRTGRPGGRSSAGRVETASGFRSRRSRKVQPRRSNRRSHPPVTEVGERTAAYLTATVLGLTLFGLVMVLSASSVSSLHQLADSPFFQFKRQAMWAGLGAVAFVVASRVDYRRLRPLAGPLLLITMAMLAALLVPGLGQRENGSTRWLGVGPFVIQPSEVAKLVLIVFVADLLARRERRMDRSELTVRPVMLVLVAVSGMIVIQPKLGTPIILSAVTLMMLFVAGARMRSLIPWVSVAVLAASALAYVADYRRDRLLAFLDPWKDPLGIGMQSIQSQVGIASGGLYGVGLGAGRAKWGFLPEAQSDFIFAIVAEEVGLIGASALIGGFLLIAWFGIRTASAAPDRFGTLLAAGITSWLLVQAFLNIGMVLGVLPITGEALPFVSAGGSSLVVTLASAGLLTSVARRVRG